MLKIQRASAGSGKTYTLARQYILHLLSVADHDTGKRRLRTREEIADASRHILAVTFTNKATREMKERIVERLADLAGRVADPSETEYMEYLTKELETREEKIRGAASLALASLLDNYSDFNVSTIDSFFQTVLRTFAYESDLNDTYQVEIDSELGARVGVDATLSSVNNPDEADADARFWIKELIETSREKGNSWNIFRKSDKNKSLYSNLIGIAKKMASEDFTRIAPYLDEYFREYPHGLRDGYLELKNRYHDICAKEDNNIGKAAEGLKSYLDSCPDDIRGAIGNLNNHVLPRISKALSSIDKLDVDKMTGYYRGKKYFNAKTKLSEVELKPAFDAIDAFYGSFAAKKDALEKAGLENWDIYASQFPFYGLLQSVSSKRADFFLTNNVVCLSDTNTLLGRVIGDDDTPFIYERLGTRLDHFLIDEFQDTSFLQWNNFRPLLREAEGRGGENLIIGDAKQSIYRFRNADPSLILEKVPSEFPDHEPHGDRPEENTNHRSFRHIVQFNNSLFRTLAALVDELREKEKRPMRRMADVYSGVVQELKDKEPRGFIEVRCADGKSLKVPASGDTDDNDAGEGSVYPPDFANIPCIINDIRSRGYEDLSDIGILVRTNEQGKWVVNALMDYNRKLGEGDKPVDFISEESLLISSSEAVKMAVATLRLIANGNYHEAENLAEKKQEIQAAAEVQDKPKQQPDKESYAERIDRSCRFNYFAARHPDLTGSVLIEKFFSGTDDISGSIHDILTGLTTAALPAIVENIFFRFVSEEIRRRDAPFIAAFQDLVADHCERYAADAASFIKWWDERGADKSITSPEGVNAVSIMTIHKSKGLERPFIIVPVIDLELVPPRISNELLWVKPELPDTCPRLPDYFPLKLDKAKASPKYKALYYEKLDAATMDSLNVAYVAFTRPRKELYVTLPLTLSSNGKCKEGTLTAIILSALEAIKSQNPSDERLLSGNLITASESDQYPCFTIGKKIAAGVDKKRTAGDTDKNIRQIGDYKVTDRLHNVKFKEEPLSSSGSEDDSDPRSEGNLFHALMERIKYPDDLPKAILSLRVEGRLSQVMERRLRELFSQGLTNPLVAEWFDVKNRAINERNIVIQGKKTGRPDRIVVRPDGSATVIDYKFGMEKPDKYKTQVSGYRRDLIDTGLFKSVDAYLWYVNLGEVVEVTQSD